MKKNPKVYEFKNRVSMVFNFKIVVFQKLICNKTKTNFVFDKVHF